MTRVVDFDAARAEAQREPVELKIGGREYMLAAGLPAALALDLMRFRVKGTDDVEVPPEQAGPLLERIFGSETWHEILDHAQLDVHELPQLLEMTIRALNGRDPTKDDGPPNRAGRRTKARRGSAGSKTGR